jgi:hypothetical protein
MKNKSKQQAGKTVQDRMKHKYQSEAWKELANYLADCMPRNWDSYTVLPVSAVMADLEQFMESKGIMPVEQERDEQ